MYVASHFREERIEVLHAAIREAGLATLVSVGPDGPIATHAPMLLDPAPAPWGRIVGHIARANPQSRETSPGVPAIALFRGPDTYITPAWYATKRNTGRVVPTWNYVAIEARGSLRFIEDPEWLRDLVERLTARHERGRAEPWAVSDAPADYVAGMLKAIVGFELTIETLVGSWKMSQNRPAEDRQGVVDGLLATGGANEEAIARLVEARAPR